MLHLWKDSLALVILPFELIRNVDMELIPNLLSIHKLKKIIDGIRMKFTMKFNKSEQFWTKQDYLEFCIFFC